MIPMGMLYSDLLMNRNRAVISRIGARLFRVRLIMKTGITDILEIKDGIEWV